jgi:hypothetical protein
MGRGVTDLEEKADANQLLAYSLGQVFLAKDEIETGPILSERSHPMIYRISGQEVLLEGK